MDSVSTLYTLRLRLEDLENKNSFFLKDTHNQDIEQQIDSQNKGNYAYPHKILYLLPAETGTEHKTFYYGENGDRATETKVTGSVFDDGAIKEIEAFIYTCKCGSALLHMVSGQTGNPSIDQTIYRFGTKEEMQKLWADFIKNLPQQGSFYATDT